MVAIESRSRGPSVIALSRQGCPNLEGSSVEAVRSGAYVLTKPASGGAAQIVLVGTGSEVSLLVSAAAQMSDLSIQLVSMPCWELFDAQPRALTPRPPRM